MRKIFIAIIVIVVLVVGFIAIGIIFDKPDRQVSSSGGGGPVPVVFGIATDTDYLNFEKILAENDMIQDLPDDATLLLEFYNFNSGGRVWEYSYVITRGNVEKGTTDDWDIRFFMHSKYLTVLNAQNYCNVVQMAINNNDFGSETELSTTRLLLKFGSMMQYRDCLGL